ncbi:glycosyltransferase family 2 protein [Desulfitobacterium sp. Sab5]|uniref:glycosyltransferase family 2 protein n=1 Tax=Desulfitobacterium nosdiversum TaxID=3375356 RepID=UPI003CF2865A
MDLSIIMINYNAKELTAKAIQSIYDTKPQISFEIIVVDNSSDETQVYRNKSLKANSVIRVENKGFGNACNIGAANARGQYILFLNNDTLMHERTLDTCVRYLQHHPHVGVLSARILLENGLLDHACKRGFPTPISSLYYFCGLDKRFPKSKKYGAYRQTFIEVDSISEVDSVAGSFLMMPNTVFEKVDGYDETFFMYGEDLDLCFRVKNNGFSVVYYGPVCITHLKGQSGLHTKSPLVTYHFYNAMLLFYKKHYLKKYNWLTTIAVYLGIKTKYALAVLKIRLDK